MTLTEAYLYLFFDNLFSAFIIPFSSEFVYKVMLTEARYNVYLIYIIASFGAVCGATINFFIGRYIYNLSTKGLFTIPDTRYKRISVLANKYPYLLSLFIPFTIINNPLVMFFGFFRANIYKFLLIIILAKLTRYYYIIF